MVWCSMSSTRLIGPCFFRDVSDRTTTVTGENYLTRMQELVEPQLQTKNDLANVFFSARRSAFPLCLVSDGFPEHHVS